MTELTLAKAVNSGLRRALSDDDRVVLLGEDIGQLGGVFRVTDGLQRDFGTERVMDMPLAESGIIGMAIVRRRHLVNVTRSPHGCFPVRNRAAERWTNSPRWR